MKKFIKYFAVAAIVAAIVYYVYSHLLKENPLEIEAVPVKRGKVEATVSSVSSGTVEPVQKVSLQPEVIGKIAGVLVKTGDRVGKGDALVLIDDSDLKKQIEISKINLKSLKVRRKQAALRADQLAKEYAKGKNLFEKEAISEQDFDRIKNGYDLAASEIEAVDAMILQTRASLEYQEDQLRKFVLKSPFDGMILKVNAKTGELAGMGGQFGSGGELKISGGSQSKMPSLESLSPSAAMIEMADDSALYAEVDIDETDAAKVRNSEKVRLIFDQLDASDFYGEVTEVYPYVQREADQNRTVRIKVKIPEELKGRVLIGMSVDAEVIIGESADTIYVPSSAVVEQAGRKFVYVAENGRLKKVEVETGLSNWEKTEIKSGLKDGDQVLVPKALDKMKEGVEVIVTGGRG